MVDRRFGIKMDDIHVSQQELDQLYNEVIGNMEDVSALPGNAYNTYLTKYSDCMGCWDDIHTYLDMAYNRVRKMNL